MKSEGRRVLPRLWSWQRPVICAATARWVEHHSRVPEVLSDEPPSLWEEFTHPRDQNFSMRHTRPFENIRQVRQYFLVFIGLSKNWDRQRSCSGIFPEPPVFARYRSTLRLGAQGSPHPGLCRARHATPLWLVQSHQLSNNCAPV